MNVDQLETERFDPVQDSVQRRLVQLTDELGIGSRLVTQKTVEGRSGGLPYPSPDDDAVRRHVSSP
jgi:hypothetical protein